MSEQLENRLKIDRWLSETIFFTFSCFSTSVCQITHTMKWHSVEHIQISVLILIKSKLGNYGNVNSNKLTKNVLGAMGIVWIKEGTVLSSIVVQLQLLN